MSGATDAAQARISGRVQGCVEKVFEMGLVAMPALVKALLALARYLPPDSGIPAQDVVTELLGILDAESVVQAADAWEQLEARRAGAA